MTQIQMRWQAQRAGGKVVNDEMLIHEARIGASQKQEDRQHIAFSKALEGTKYLLQVISLGALFCKKYNNDNIFPESKCNKKDATEQRNHVGRLELLNGLLRGLLASRLRTLRLPYRWCDRMATRSEQTAYIQQTRKSILFFSNLFPSPRTYTHTRARMQ